DRQPAPAPRLRPADAAPAPGRELALPGLEQRRVCVVIAGPAAMADRCEAAGQVRGHPLRHLGAKSLVVGRESELHGRCGSRACGRNGRHGLVERRGRDALAPLLRRAEPVTAGLRALEVQVRVVLPREARTAVQLDGLLRTEEEGLARLRLRRAGL